MRYEFTEDTARTWAEVDLGCVGRNAEAIQGFLGEGAFALAVVKADAYGHGADRVARECLRAGIGHFGVAGVAEALEIRAAGVHPGGGDIYLLSPFLPDEAEAVVRADLVPMVSSPAQMEALLRVAHRARRPARCFLKLDTGMGRSGALPEDARDLWNLVAEGPDRNLRITGIATHLSSADEISEGADTATEKQIEVFRGFVESVGDLAAAATGGGLWLTLTNSPGALRFSSLVLPRHGIRGILVRAGLLLYGIEPYKNAFLSSGTPAVEPALTWRARITLLRDLPQGATIGYGRTHTLSRPSRIATIAAGYADGLPRRLSNTGAVLLQGRRFPIVGRVSMDQCQIDVTDAPETVILGDTVTVLGADGAERQSA
ncbi:MAG: alanine racemase, partial [Cytophagales bacterium]|nr:alanine racemase [Armatimonadota bacterium]